MSINSSNANPLKFRNTNYYNTDIPIFQNDELKIINLKNLHDIYHNSNDEGDIFVLTYNNKKHTIEKSKIKNISMYTGKRNKINCLSNIKNNNVFMFKPVLYSNKLCILGYNKLINKSYYLHFNDIKADIFLKTHNLSIINEYQYINKLKNHTKTIGKIPLDEHLGFLCGNWLFNGKSVNYNNLDVEAIVFGCKENEQHLFETTIKNLNGFGKSTTMFRNEQLYVFNSELNTFLNSEFVSFPNYHIKKREAYVFFKKIPNWILNSNNYFLENFLIGAMSNAKNDINTITLTTFSKKIATKITTLFKLRFGMFYRIEKSIDTHTNKIEYKMVFNRNDDQIASNMINSEFICLSTKMKTKLIYNIIPEKNDNIINIDGLILKT